MSTQFRLKLPSILQNSSSEYGVCCNGTNTIPGLNYRSCFDQGYSWVYGGTSCSTNDSSFVFDNWYNVNINTNTLIHFTTSIEITDIKLINDLDSDSESLSFERNGNTVTVTLPADSRRSLNKSYKLLINGKYFSSPIYMYRSSLSWFDQVIEANPPIDIIKDIQTRNDIIESGYPWKVSDNNGIEYVYIPAGKTNRFLLSDNFGDSNLIDDILNNNTGSDTKPTLLDSGIEDPVQNTSRPYYRNIVGNTRSIIDVECAESQLVENKISYHKLEHHDIKNKLNTTAEITKPFYLSTKKITQKIWYDVMGTNPSGFSLGVGITANLPVESVSWTTIQEFLNNTNTRLLTATEWAYSLLGSQGRSKYKKTRSDQIEFLDFVLPESKLNTKTKAFNIIEPSPIQPFSFMLGGSTSSSSLTSSCERIPLTRNMQELYERYGFYSYFEYKSFTPTLSEIPYIISNQGLDYISPRYQLDPSIWASSKQIPLHISSNFLSNYKNSQNQIDTTIDNLDHLRYMIFSRSRYLWIWNNSYKHPISILYTCGTILGSPDVLKFCNHVPLISPTGTMNLDLLCDYSGIQWIRLPNEVDAAVEGVFLSLDSDALPSSMIASVAFRSADSNEIVITTQQPHECENYDIVSLRFRTNQSKCSVGLSSDVYSGEGYYVIKIDENKFTLQTDELVPVTMDTLPTLGGSSNPNRQIAKERFSHKPSFLQNLRQLRQVTDRTCGGFNIEFDTSIGPELDIYRTRYKWNEPTCTDRLSECGCLQNIEYPYNNKAYIITNGVAKSIDPSGTETQLTTSNCGQNVFLENYNNVCVNCDNDTDKFFTPHSDFKKYIKNMAWTSLDSEDKTHPVGLKEENGFGLYDMLGNVQEWTTDLYHPVFDNIEMQPDELYNKDPFGCMIDRGRGRIVCGVHWGQHYCDCIFNTQITLFQAAKEDFTSNQIGFRVARNIDEDIDIYSITPNIMGIGQETTPVIIKGNNFIQGMTLQIGDTAVGYTLLNKSTVFLNIPTLSPNTYTITVEITGSTAELQNALTVTGTAGWTAVDDDSIYFDESIKTDANNTRDNEHSYPSTITHSESGIEFVLVPAGHTIIGCTGHDCPENTTPQKTVKIPKAFYMSKYPITQTQWLTVMGSTYSLNYSPGTRYQWSSYNPVPITKITPIDISKFINKLNNTSNFKFIFNGNTFGLKQFRLPTEFEWEYAYRSRSNSDYHPTEDNTPGSNLTTHLNTISNYNNSSDPSSDIILGTKAPNGFGLYDMSGGVYEFTASKLLESYNNIGDTDDYLINYHKNEWPHFIEKSNENRTQSFDYSDIVSDHQFITYRGGNFSNSEFSGIRDVIDIDATSNKIAIAMSNIVKVYDLDSNKLIVNNPSIFHSYRLEEIPETEESEPTHNVSINRSPRIHKIALSDNHLVLTTNEVEYGMNNGLETGNDGGYGNKKTQYQIDDIRLNNQLFFNNLPKMKFPRTVDQLSSRLLKYDLSGSSYPVEINISDIVGITLPSGVDPIIGRGTEIIQSLKTKKDSTEWYCAITKIKDPFDFSIEDEIETTFAPLDRIRPKYRFLEDKFNINDNYNLIYIGSNEFTSDTDASKLKWNIEKLPFNVLGFCANDEFVYIAAKAKIENRIFIYKYDLLNKTMQPEPLLSFDTSLGNEIDKRIEMEILDNFLFLLTDTTDPALIKINLNTHQIETNPLGIPLIGPIRVNNYTQNSLQHNVYQNRLIKYDNKLYFIFFNKLLEIQTNSLNIIDFVYNPQESIPPLILNKISAKNRRVPSEQYEDVRFTVFYIDTYGNKYFVTNDNRIYYILHSDPIDKYRLRQLILPESFQKSIYDKSITSITIKDSNLYVTLRLSHNPFISRGNIGVTNDPILQRPYVANNLTSTNNRLKWIWAGGNKTICDPTIKSDISSSPNPTDPEKTPNHNLYKLSINITSQNITINGNSSPISTDSKIDFIKINNINYARNKYMVHRYMPSCGLLDVLHWDQLRTVYSLSPLLLGVLINSRYPRYPRTWIGSNVYFEFDVRWTGPESPFYLTLDKTPVWNETRIVNQGDFYLKNVTESLNGIQYMNQIVYQSLINDNHSDPDNSSEWVKLPDYIECEGCVEKMKKILEQDHFWIPQSNKESIFLNSVILNDFIFITTIDGLVVKNTNNSTYCRYRGTKFIDIEDIKFIENNLYIVGHYDFIKNNHSNGEHSSFLLPLKLGRCDSCPDEVWRDEYPLVGPYGTTDKIHFNVNNDIDLKGYYSNHERINFISKFDVSQNKSLGFNRITGSTYNNEKGFSKVNVDVIDNGNKLIYSNNYSLIKKSTVPYSPIIAMNRVVKNLKYIHDVLYTKNENYSYWEHIIGILDQPGITHVPPPLSPIHYRVDINLNTPFTTTTPIPIFDNQSEFLSSEQIRLLSFETGCNFFNHSSYYMDSDDKHKEHTIVEFDSNNEKLKYKTHRSSITEISSSKYIQFPISTSLKKYRILNSDFKKLSDHPLSEDIVSISSNKTDYAILQKNTISIYNNSDHKNPITTIEGSDFYRAIWIGNKLFVVTKKGTISVYDKVSNRYELIQTVHAGIGGKKLAAYSKNSKKLIENIVNLSDDTHSYFPYFDFSYLDDNTISDDYAYEENNKKTLRYNNLLNLIRHVKVNRNPNVRYLGLINQFPHPFYNIDTFLTALDYSSSSEYLHLMFPYYKSSYLDGPLQYASFDYSLYYNLPPKYGIYDFAKNRPHLMYFTLYGTTNSTIWSEDLISLQFIQKIEPNYILPGGITFQRDSYILSNIHTSGRYPLNQTIITKYDMLEEETIENPYNSNPLPIDEFKSPRWHIPTQHFGFRLICNTI